jgi:hypothetical protein
MAIERDRGHFIAVALAALLVAGCGGGSGDDIATSSADCSVTAQKVSLRADMQDRYFWSGVSPDPEPAPYASVADYFQALLLPGEGSADPAHFWSYITDTASYNQFYAEGRSLGYGVVVNDIERQPPLKLRYVEEQSPGGLAGLKRGDTVVSINGRSAVDLLASQDFGLGTSTAGDTVTIVVDRGAGPLSFTLTAASYSLSPVTAARLIDLGGGRRAGYLVLKEFITLAEAPLADSIDGFIDQGASELIVDMRYNGGGRISTSAYLASLIAGVARSGVYAHLDYNARHQASNFDFVLGGATRVGFDRVVVLTGPRTCSASELVVNGLKPYLDVVTVGGTTCGKPFGFNPRSHCGSTFSAVNFESVNRLGNGHYYDGIAASCAVAEDFNGALGDPNEKLTAAAIDYLKTGTCPIASAPQRAQAQALSRRVRMEGAQPGERQGMFAD